MSRLGGRLRSRSDGSPDDRSAAPAHSRLESVGWGIAFLVLVALSIPWFLWRDDATAFGLPLWLWWHAGWMVVASLTFAAFASRAWGLWVESGEPGESGGGGR